MTPHTVRLPRTCIPERYELTLEPDLRTSTFRGTVRIAYTLTKASRLVVLHAVGLTLHSVSAQTPRGTEIGTHRASPKHETVTLTFPRPLPKGSGTLELSFHGSIQEKMRGLYRSTYRVDGVEKVLAVTQFESTFARHAFPCFDEPDKKATFDITLIVDDSLTAVSNTEEVASHSAHGKRTITFARTPRMSTYLVACVVGELDYLEARSKRGVLTRVYTPRGKKHQAAFALETAVRCLDFYEGYFGIPYPLKKVDHIAIPDFAAGAMENWGAITYRESALLYDPQNSSLQNKQRVALVIAHELAHQWFGNLVTMEWWTDLWLNEGFANYIEYVALDALFPEWQMWTHFVEVDAGEALRLDALASTHPIEIEVHHPSEINEIFDAVSYAKGASVIRMLAMYLGERAFRRGLNAYLTENAYKNATTNDLWKSLSVASGKPVRRMMRHFTLRGGYPVLTVTRVQKGLSVSQERFFASGARSEERPWVVPIAMRGTRTAYHLMSTRTATLPHRNGAPNLNADASGFYRVNYDAVSLRELRDAAHSGSLTPKERVRLLDDAFALAASGRAPIASALELAAFVSTDTDFSVVRAYVSALRRLKPFLEGSSTEEGAEGLLDAYTRAMLTPQLVRVGLHPQKSESPSDALTRGLVAYALLEAGEASVVKELQSLYAQVAHVSPDMRLAVYAAVSRTPRGLDHLITRYTTEDLHEEKNRILVAMSSAPHGTRRVLEFALGADVRAQDTCIAFMGASRSLYQAREARAVLEKHWPLILERYGTSGHDLPRFIHTLDVFNTKEDERAVKEFLVAHKAPGATRAAAQCLETVRMHVAWRKKHSAELRAWLRSFTSPNDI